MILPTHQKLRLIQKVIKEGACVSQVCAENKISRKTFYQWKKKYLAAGPRVKSSSLQNRHPKGLQHFRGTKNRFKNEILDIVTVHPEWGSHTLAKRQKRLGNHGIYSLLKELNLETYSKRKEFALLHRSLKTVKNAYLPSQRRLLSETRKRMVEEVLLAGKAVGEVAKEFNISRKTLWKWAKRYEKAKLQEVQLIFSLEDQNPKGSLHPRGTASWLEQKILDQVIKNPAFSTHQLAKIIPEIGNHGIQNVLLRNGLNKIDMRIRYAQSQVPAISIQPVKTWVGRLKSVFESFVPSISSAPPPLRSAEQNFEGARPPFPLLKPFFLSFFSTTVFLLALLNWISIFSQQTIGAQIGLFFASISLATGTVFLAYSMKYYLSLALVLSYSSREGEGIGGIGGDGGNGGIGGWLKRIFSSAEQNSAQQVAELNKQTNGLQANLDHIKLERYPFISIQLPFYNEKKVANRIISACTSMDYPNFEVIVCDDSTDETVDIVNEWKNHPRVRILHRPTREGFKGGALSYALKAMDPRTEFVCVFDADFVPYPDSLMQFVKYFKSTGSWSEDRTFRADSVMTMPYQTFENIPWTKEQEETLVRQEEEMRKKGDTAVVAGYQWHVLNKSENWVTRGVRTEYSGSYVIERPAQEIVGALKIIHGSVYCMRADVMKHFGWGTSITEDYEMTLRIYEKGFKVCYTPYVQAPSECVSTIKRLIRQRMRWAEGHSFNTRKMFKKLMFNPKLTLAEKIEFAFLTPYYLQAFLFIVGTLAWLLSEVVFKVRLPFWTALWGWSLILTNFLALPLLNSVGLFLEESEEKDYIGILSFMALCYIVVPFQAYAAVKGFIESKEGPWFRTPKTGIITDVLTRGRFYRWLTGILRWKPAMAELASRKLGSELLVNENPYFALSTSHNVFANFQIRPKQARWLGKTFLVILLIFSTLLISIAPGVPYLKKPAQAQGFGLLSSEQTVNKPVELVKEVIPEKTVVGEAKPDLPPEKENLMTRFGQKIKEIFKAFWLLIMKNSLSFILVDLIQKKNDPSILVVEDFIPESEVNLIFSFGQQSLEEEKPGEFKTTITDYAGNVIEKKTEIKPRENGEVEVKISELDNLSPGAYSVKIEKTVDGKTEILTQEFLWGVLAINTNKVQYSPGENVYLQMAALDKTGHTLCDADLKLVIIDPQEKIIVPTINRSETCGNNNVTDNPDYFSYYQLDSRASLGKYNIKLVNNANNYSIESFFEVSNNIPFVLERIGATRINPFIATYFMTLKIKANQDFEGQIIEKLPSDFEVIQAVGGKVENTDNAKEIVWEVKIPKDQQMTLQYEYQAPKTSPKIYFLGPLEFYDSPSTDSTSSLQSSLGLPRFSEARRWQIASDAIAYVNASTPDTDAAGAFTVTGMAPAQAGNIIILQVLQDGTTNGAVTFTSATNIENLAGTDNAWTAITEETVGASDEARQYLWIGRSLSTSAPTFTGGNSTSEDVYFRMYQFSGVSAGTTLAEVIENSTAGSWVNGSGTSTSVLDTGVTTLGTLRLALNFIGYNDDVPAGELTAMTGETGGDWTYPVAAYGSSSGTDGGVALVTAAMASAGTIDGGSDAITSYGWGVIGFALIPEFSPTTALGTPADDATVTDTTPDLTFTGTDGNGDEISYHLQIATDSSFTSIVKEATSSSNIGFSGSPDSSDPFASGQSVTYTASSSAVVYYFDGSDAVASDPGSKWTADDSGFDSDSTPSTYASLAALTTATKTSNYLMAEGTSAPATGNIIIGVQARVNGGGMTPVNTGGTVYATVYTDGVTEELGTAYAYAPSDGIVWGSYVTLNMPSGGWTWSKIQALEARYWGSSASMSSVYATKIEIKVDYGDVMSSNTYYWRVRAMDPTGSNAWGAWSPGDSTLGYDHFHLQEVVTISGYAYDDETSTKWTACNGSTSNISLVINGGTASTTTCDGTTGYYSFSDKAVAQNNPVSVFLNATDKGAAISVASSSAYNITLNPRKGRIWVTTEPTVTSISNSNLDHCDKNVTGCSNIPYTVTTNNLTTDSGYELHIESSKTYDPGGTVTTDATGGDLHIDDSATAYLDTATSTIGGDVLVDGGATLNIQQTTIVGGGAITTSGTSAIVTYTGTPVLTMRGTGDIGGGTTPSITFYDLTIGDGTTATTTLLSTVATAGDVSVGTGSTLNINAALNVQGGALTTTTTGIVNTTSGTSGVTMTGTGNIGPGSGGSFTAYSLAINGTQTMVGDISTSNNVTVGTGASLALGSKNLNILGGGFTTTTTGVVSCTACSAGTVTISGTGNVGPGTGGSMTVYNLTVNGSQTLTGDVVVSSDLSVGSSGTLALGSKNLTVNGGDATTTTTGVISCSSCTAGTLTVKGTGNLGAGSGGSITVYNLTIGTGTITLTSDIIINEDLTVGDGGASTFEVNTNDKTVTTKDFSIVASGIYSASSNSTYPLNVSGSFGNAGNFTHNNGKVVLNGAGGTTQAITGSTDFFDLTATTASHRTITFAAGSTTGINTNGTLTLTGTSCEALLVLRSATPGTHWHLNRVTPGTGSNSLSYLDIQDSENTGQVLTAATSVNSGGNTSWTITASACFGASSSSLATAYSFQRKTFYDTTYSRYWMFYYDGGAISIKYSADNDGATWTGVAPQNYNTNDFSVWNSAGYVFLAVKSGSDIKILQGQLGTSSITWNGTIKTPFTGGSDSYSYPYLSLDSSNYLWVVGRFQSGSNYTIQAIKSDNTVGANWTSLGWETASTLTDESTSSNVYANLSSLGSGNMYAAFIVNDSIQGCKWIGGSTNAWQDSNGASCIATTVSLSEIYRPAKIDEAGDWGVITGGGKQVVRISTGDLYAVATDSGTLEVWKSTDGNNWTQKDTSNSPTNVTGSVTAVAVDTNNTLHIAYSVSLSLYYVSFSTSSNTFGTPYNFSTDASIDMAIAVDSNSIPHIVNSQLGAASSCKISYRNKVGGSWNTAIDIETWSSSCTIPSVVDITINEDNIPEVAYVNSQEGYLSAAVGDANNPTSFGTPSDIDTTINNTAGQRGCSIGIDSSGNTWVAYVDATTNYATLIEHHDADAWTSWQTAITNSNVGYEPSIAVNGTKIYIFYENDTDDIAYEMRDDAATAWLGERVLEDGTYQDVKTRWSSNFWNKPTQLDYLFSDGTDVYWNYLQTSVNIDNSSDFGALLGAGRQIVTASSSGALYTAVNDGGYLEVWKSTNGNSWTQQDSINSPSSVSSPIALAIDRSDNLHLIFGYLSGVQDVGYISFDTTDNTFTGSVVPLLWGDMGGGTCLSSLGIAIDLNDKPHLVCSSGDYATLGIKYKNKTGADWSSTVTIESAIGYSVDITINEDNIPEVAYISGGYLTAAVGNANNASSFGTPYDIDTTVNNTADQRGSSIGIDNAGNTWIAYVDATTNYVTLTHHHDTDAWTSWQTSQTNSNVGHEPSIAVQGSSVYVFYDDENDDVAYDKYDGTAWKGETILHKGTFQDVKVKWSSNFWNQPKHLDYLYSDNTDVYWNVLDINLSIDDASDFGYLTGAGRQIVRTSTGTLYSVLNDGGNLEVWQAQATSSATWVQQVPGTSITCTSGYPVSAVIDNNQDIHIAYINGAFLYYRNFDTATNAWDAGGEELVYLESNGDGVNSIEKAVITVDSYNVPHVVYISHWVVDASPYGQIAYDNRFGGSWNAVDINISSSRENIIDLTIDKDNKPQASYIEGTGLHVARGNANDATDFSTDNYTIDGSISEQNSSIAVDPVTGDTWFSYIDLNGSIKLSKHAYGDGWTTWSHNTSKTDISSEPSIVVNGTDIYVFYEDDNDNIVYDKYNGSSWSGEVFLRPGTLLDVKTRWSYTNNPSYTNYGIDYLYSDSGDVYYDNLILAGGSETIVGSRDTIATGKNGVSSNFSMSSDTSNNLHLTYIDASDYVQYTKYSAGEWSAPTQIIGSASSYTSISVDTSTDNIYAVYFRSGTMYYKVYTTSWGTETDTGFTEGTSPTNLTTNYSGDRVFAEWTYGSGPYNVNWGLILIPEKIWLFMGLGLVIPELLRRRRRRKLNNEVRIVNHGV